VTVEFEKISYTLTYTAGENGSITGDSPQSVKYGENGSGSCLILFGRCNLFRK
jgi:hypothetical protein